MIYQGFDRDTHFKCVMHLSQLMNASIRLERANTSHSISLWNLRNEYTSRIMFRDQSLVPWDKHQAWFKSLLQDSNRFLYVATGSQGEVLGSIRFDPGDDCQQTYCISINVSPLCRGARYRLINVKAWD